MLSAILTCFPFKIATLGKNSATVLLVVVELIVFVLNLAALLLLIVSVRFAKIVAECSQPLGPSRAAQP